MKLRFPVLLIAKVLIAPLLVCGVVMPVRSFAEQPAPSAPSSEAEYRIGPEDLIQIQVWGRSDLSSSVPVDLNGRIQLPLVGDVEAKGRTTGELSKYLTERYRLLDPSIPEVIVTIAEYNSESVTIVGEVRNPGRHGFRKIPDLWTIILAAGGATPNADLGRVQVVRKEEKEGEPHSVTVDLSGGIDRPPPEGLPTVRPKDTIVVPSLAENAGAAAGDRFQILGAVRNPGMYRISAAKNVVEAISVSGGTLPEANLEKILVTRPSSAGAMCYEIDLQKYLKEGAPGGQLELKPGDTITIPQSGGTGSAFLNLVTRFSPVISVVASVLSVAWVRR